MGVEATPDEMRPLEAATSEQLIDELYKRLPGGLLVIGLSDVRGYPTKEMFQHRYRGGWHTALGLVEAARIVFRAGVDRISADGSKDDDEES